FTRHFSSLLHPRHPPPPLFPYTTLFRSVSGAVLAAGLALRPAAADDIGKQVTCPVMGSSFKVSKSTEFRMVNGQAVYFCCGGCPAAFDKEPEKYLTKVSIPNCPVMPSNEVSTPNKGL